MNIPGTYELWHLREGAPKEPNFPGDFELTARIEADGLNDALERAKDRRGLFRKREPWHENPGVTCLKQTREASPGDVFVGPDGWRYRLEEGRWLVQGRLHGEELSRPPTLMEYLKAFREQVREFVRTSAEADRVYFAKFSEDARFKHIPGQWADFRVEEGRDGVRITPLTEYARAYAAGDRRFQSLEREGDSYLLEQRPGLELEAELCVEGWLVCEGPLPEKEVGPEVGPDVEPELDF
jgi:hypothetical protein